MGEHVREEDWLGVTFHLGTKPDKLGTDTASVTKTVLLQKARVTVVTLLATVVLVGIQSLWVLRIRILKSHSTGVGESPAVNPTLQ